MAAGGREVGLMAEGEGIWALCAVETSHSEARKFAASEFHFLNLERLCLERSQDRFSALLLIDGVTIRNVSFGGSMWEREETYVKL